MLAVRAERLVQRFGARVALGPLDLELGLGQRLAVLGGNGAGKTTLLRILATAARPAAGRVELLGLDVGRQRERLRARLGYVGHQVGLYPALTAQENLEFFAALHGLGRPEAAAALAQLGLQALARHRVERLSRGQQQRLALARAVLHRPELLVLDEPDASLDRAGRDVLGQLFEGRTVVLATHDAELARELCDRALLLCDGREAGDRWALESARGVGPPLPEPPLWSGPLGHLRCIPSEGTREVGRRLEDGLTRRAEPLLHAATGPSHPLVLARAEAPASRGRLEGSG